MISALTWIRKGVAKATPEKYELTEEQYSKIMERATAELADAREGLEKAKKQKKEKRKKSKAAAAAAANMMVDAGEDDMAKFHLSDYDNEEDGTFEATPSEDLLDLFMQDAKGLAATAASEDPHISKEAAAEDEASDDEDLNIRPTDSLVLTCKTSEEVSYLEVNLYEEAEDNAYVHHDLMLPTFPLCVEPILAHCGAPAAEASRGCLAAIGTFDPEIEIWDLDVLDVAYPALVLGATEPGSKKASKRRVKNATHHVDAVMSLSWNRQHGNMLLSGSADSTIKLWDLGSGACVRSFDHHTDKVQAVQWNPAEASRIISASYDGSITVFDARTPQDQAAWRGLLTSDVESVKWSPLRPECFAVSEENGLVHLIDARMPDAAPLFRLQAHSKATTAIDFHPAVPDCLLTAGVDKAFKVWKTTGNTPVCVLSREPEVGKLFAASFCPDSAFLLAVAGSRGDLRYFNLAKNEAIIEAFSS